MSNLVDHALQYASMGWHVFPVSKNKKPLTPHGFEDATTEEGQIRVWWAQWPTAGIGVATGLKSGIVVLDIDDKPGVQDRLMSLAQKKGQFPETVAAKTGGGGYHFYFRHPGEGVRVPSVVKLFGYVGIDVRGDGGYVVVPPSPHSSGTPYAWGDDQSPFEANLEECPVWLHENKQRKTFAFSTTIIDGERNSTLTSIAGMLRSLGFDEQVIGPLLHQQNQTRCNPPLPDGEIDAIISGIIKYPPYNTGRVEVEGTTTAASDNLLSFPRTDAGHAEMFGAVYLGRIRFNFSTGRWMVWKKYWWQEDTGDQILQMAVHAARRLQNAAASIVDEDQRIEAIKHAKSLENVSRITTMLQMARSLPTIATTQLQWNTQKHLLGVANGVIDLRTGEMVEPRPDDLISRHVTINFDPYAESPRWDQFLLEVFNNNLELIEFFHRAVGYSLTGETKEQCLFLLNGLGSNGKSIIIQVLRWISGAYGTTTPFSTFERNQNASAQTNDLAALAGMRLVLSSEANEGVSFNESRIKHFTGGEEITARFLHQEFFTFQPEGKIWIAVNALPRVHDDSDGFWRRVLRVDFPMKFTEEVTEPRGKLRPVDRELDRRLMAELDGILSWAVGGAVKWYESGLKKPEAVLLATKTYRQDSDPLFHFFSHFDFSEEHQIESEVAWKAYMAWAKERQLKMYEILSSARFHAKMSKDFTRVMEGPKTFYRGLALKPEFTKLSVPEPKVIQLRRTKADSRGDTTGT